MNTNNNKQPIISVIIPAYNEQDFLGRCLKSLQEQINAPIYEVILVDNNSTDNTAHIAKSFKAKVIKEPIKGVMHARQAGLKVAKGEIIVTTDADCFYKPYWLSNIYKTYQNNPNIIGLAGHYYFYNGALWASIMPQMGALFVWLIYKFTNKVVYVSATNFSFKRQYIKSYNTKYPMGADEKILLNQLVKQGKVNFVINNPVYTSARRVNQGFWHSIIVTIGYFYAYNVWHTNKKGFSKIGAPPDIRIETKPSVWQTITSLALLLIFVILTIYFINFILT
jgi:glycosyltransferase involved in cell wall biosynthesis